MLVGLAWRLWASGADPDFIRTSEWDLTLSSRSWKAGYDFRVSSSPRIPPDI